MTSLLLGSCVIVAETRIDLSDIKSKNNVRGSLLIKAPPEVRARLGALLIQTSNAELSTCGDLIQATYTIYKSGVERDLEAYSWGLYYGRNNTLIIFFRKDFLQTLRASVERARELGEDVEVKFSFYNDTMSAVTMRIRGSWVDGEPVSVEVMTKRLAPLESVEISLSRLSMHYILRTGVDSLVTIEF